jgi:tRNA(Ile)-lysidine synthase
MRAGDVIATAHHLDDQAETVLLRLCRGTGVDGLAGMRRLSRFPPGRQWRPLLTQPRAALRAFAQAQDLRWIEDPQNRDPRFSRSWLRHNVMPLLRTRWPAVDQALARSADHAASTATLLRDLAELDLHALRSGPGLSIEALLGLTAPRRRNALRAWLRDYGLRGPANDVLQRIEREVLSAADDAQPCLQLEALELRRYRDVLRLMPKLPPVPPAGFSEWSGSAALDLPPGCGRLEADAAPPVPLRVRFVQGGESIRPGVTTHSRSLKNLFQEAGIPPWVRQRAPLLFREERLVAVADLWLELDFQTLCARQGWSYRWQRAPELGEGA